MSHMPALASPATFQPYLPLPRRPGRVIRWGGSLLPVGLAIQMFSGWKRISLRKGDFPLVSPLRQPKFSENLKISRDRASHIGCPFGKEETRTAGGCFAPPPSSASCELPAPLSGATLVLHNRAVGAGFRKRMEGSNFKIRTLHGHTDSARGCALSADGKLALSASDDKTCILWNTQDGTRLRTLRGHTGRVIGCALSADGKLAMSASRDHTCILWNAQDGTRLRTLQGHSIWLNACALSADGKVALSAAEDGTCILWNTQDGTELRTLQKNTDSVLGCALSADGKLALLASVDKTCTLWNTEDGTRLRTLPGHKWAVQGCALSADGKLAFSVSVDKTCILWNTQDRTEPRTLFEHTSRVYGCALSADGKLALSGSMSGTCILWNTQDGAELQTLQETEAVLGCALSADGKLAMSAGEDGTCILWNTRAFSNPKGQDADSKADTDAPDETMTMTNQDKKKQNIEANSAQQEGSSGKPVTSWDKHDIVKFIKTFSTSGNQKWAKCIEVVLEYDLEYSVLEDCEVGHLVELGIPELFAHSLLKKLQKLSGEDASIDAKVATPL